MCLSVCVKLGLRAHIPGPRRAQVNAARGSERIGVQASTVFQGVRLPSYKHVLLQRCPTLCTGTCADHDQYHQAAVLLTDSTNPSTPHLHQDTVPAAALQLLVEERKRLCHSVVIAGLRVRVRPPAAAAGGLAPCAS